MAEEIIEGVNPTRMELLEIRKKLSLAEKGHDLLEEKRDALVEKFFGIIDKRNHLVEETNEEFKDAFHSLIQAEMILGEEKVEYLSHNMPLLNKVSFDEDNIMGVKIPTVEMEDQKEVQAADMYGFFETCATFDDAQQKFTNITSKLLDLAELEGKIKNLSIEIEKTKRRVNVLENTLIPKLKNTQKYIEMQLEEREREDFFRRKRIKALLKEQEKEE